MKAWEPINYGGTIYYDPREELIARVRSAQDNNDKHLSISIELAMAVATLKECDSRTRIIYDEGIKLKRSIQIKCRKPDNHQHSHFNGHMSWED